MAASPMMALVWSEMPQLRAVTGRLGVSNLVSKVLPERSTDKTDDFPGAGNAVKRSWKLEVSFPSTFRTVSPNLRPAFSAKLPGATKPNIGFSVDTGSPRTTKSKKTIPMADRKFIPGHAKKITILFHQ